MALGRRFEGFHGHVTVYKTYIAYYANMDDGTLELRATEPIGGRALFVIAEALLIANGDKIKPAKREVSEAEKRNWR